MIADSSSLILYAKALQLDVLRRTAARIVVPPEVQAECLAGQSHRPDAVALAKAIEERWLVVEEAPRTRVEALRRRYGNLGAGELAALGVAVARAGEEFLTDDAGARRAAMVEGVAPIGSLGVLARALQRGILDRAGVRTSVAARLDAGLWVAPTVLESFWAGVGGREA